MNTIKCENCKNMQCVDDLYKSYYCMREDGYIQISVDKLPKKPPKSCPKLKDNQIKNLETTSQ